MIPKDVTPRQDNAIPSDALRPISTCSVFWRLFTSAIARDPEVQRWSLQWRLPCAHGGFPEHGVHTALFALEKSYRKNKVLVTLDLAKGFDYLDPSIAVQCMCQLGFPEQYVLACGRRNFVGFHWEDTTRNIRFVSRPPCRRATPWHQWLSMQLCLGLLTPCRISSKMEKSLSLTLMIVLSLRRTLPVLPYSEMHGEWRFKL